MANVLHTEMPVSSMEPDQPTEQEPASSSVTVPTFEQEWQDTPRWATNYTEQQIAEYWFIRGQHAKEVELLAGMNHDLREMIRVARERIGR